MSKEIAQTVGGKKLGLLLGVLALIAVSMGLWQAQGAKADVGATTVAWTASPTGSVAAGATVTYTATVAHTLGANTGTLVIALPTGVTLASSSCATTATGGTASSSNTATCSIGGTVTTAGTVTFTVLATVNNVANNTAVGTATATATQGTSTGSATTATGFTVANTSPTGGTTVVGVNGTVSFTLPAGITYCSDVAGATPRTRVAGDIVITNGTLVSATDSDTNEANPDTLTVVATPTGTANVTVAVSTHAATSTVTTDCVSNTATLVVVTPLLRHMGGPTNQTVVTVQDVYNNVRGSRHVVCATDGTNGVVIPLTQATQVNVQSGGYYKVPGDQSPSFSDPQFFTQTVGASTATCFSWVSTGAGDQELSVTYPNVNGGIVTVDFGGVNANASLIKEWNVLETSTVGGATLVNGGGTNNVTYSKSIGLTLNPSTGAHTFTPVVLTDKFGGTHTTRNGGQTIAGVAAPDFTSLARVPWTVTLAGCGLLNGNAAAAFVANPALISGTTYSNANGTVGGTPSVTFSPGTVGSTDCAVGSQAVITFTGQEPGPIGSAPGNIVTQTVTINFTQVIPIKQVLLAWAGQRVLIEHDWRLPNAENADGSPRGSCPFESGTGIIYAKSAEGPGNFVQALGATISQGGNFVGYQPDAIVVLLSGTNQLGDAPTNPQGSCISRAMYESEDQGEVDIEAFVNSTAPADLGASKIAFVIYYMKLNQVTLSAVSQVSKPTHNSTNSDWNPGNPWDASKDASAAVDWNVSKDLLIRGRITGWFLNSNPSGRARDASDPQNVLPADRWVMPDDWVNIAGGSRLAQTFRPSYDLMFAPNNAVGISLATPSGYTATLTANSIQIATLATGSGKGTTTSPLVLTSAANLSVGNVIIVGGTYASVCSISGNTITVSIFSTAFLNVLPTSCPTTAVPFSTAPAVGTPVYLVIMTGNNSPFVGPYSLVDEPGFSGVDGIFGAALNNGGNGVSNVPLFRDTTQGDGVVDMWDAPMPSTEASVMLRGTGFIKQVYKEDVYYIGTANSSAQVYPNPYYYSNIPEYPYLAPVATGGGYSWDSWGGDGPNVTGCPTSTYNPCSGGMGPYHFWQAVSVGVSGFGSDSTVSAAQATELANIRLAYGDPTIARDLVVFSDNHGEFMVIANGDFKTDLTACSTNVLGGGKQCKTGDKVGTATITAAADYPDFIKHFPIASNNVTVNWTWGGYKDVTVEAGETDQFKYLVFHAMDRDGFCAALTGATLLHPVLTALDSASPVGGNTALGNQVEMVDFLIDSGDGRIISTSGGGTLLSNLAGGVSLPTYSVALNAAAGGPIKAFPLSPLAASGQTDECQAWIKISNSLLGQTNILAIAHDDEGNVGFDKVIDLTSSMSYTLNFRWSLITWQGADGIPVGDALTGGASTKNPAGTDISASVTAVYGWAQDSQSWLAYFPSGVNVPGANNLTSLKLGSAYWIAITGPGSVTWTVSTNVG